MSIATNNGSEGGSSATTNNNKKNDPAWKYNYLKNLNDIDFVTCIFCDNITSGGIYRAKLHQVGSNKNAARWLKCPEHVNYD